MSTGHGVPRNRTLWSRCVWNVRGASGHSTCEQTGQGRESQDLSELSGIEARGWTPCPCPPLLPSNWIGDVGSEICSWRGIPLGVIRNWARRAMSSRGDIGSAGYTFHGWAWGLVKDILFSVLVEFIIFWRDQLGIPKCHLGCDGGMQRVRPQNVIVTTWDNVFILHLRTGLGLSGSQWSLLSFTSSTKLCPGRWEINLSLTCLVTRLPVLKIVQACNRSSKDIWWLDYSHLTEVHYRKDTHGVNSGRSIKVSLGNISS
jgi:hypothetical protein